MNSIDDKQLKLLIDRPASDFVLHRKPMLLIDKLVDIGIDHAVCEWTVRPEDAFFVQGLGVPAYIGIEYMAQCVAVHGGACEKAHGFPPPKGMLLGTRSCSLNSAYFEEGMKYQSRCDVQIRGSGGVAGFVCNITHEGKMIAEARLSVWQLARGEDFDE